MSDIPILAGDSSTSIDPSVAAACSGLRVTAVEDGHPIAAQAGDLRHENQLIKGRLGPIAALFAALRMKHVGTATHSLRVAIAASGWAAHRNMPTEQRDELEIAALLHDIGKLGIADAVIQKPARLDVSESREMARHRLLGAELLNFAGAPEPVIDTIATAVARFDGSDADVPLSGNEIPILARMLAILDAWDSMTSSHVWRKAFSRERALAELFEHSGNQFDPELVDEFAHLVNDNHVVLERGVASRWLQEIDAQSVANWQPRPTHSNSESNTLGPFERHLMENLPIGIVFVEKQKLILKWNDGCERLTGVSSDAAVGKQWMPSLIEMHDSEGKRIHDEDCPVGLAIATNTTITGRVEITGRSGRHVNVNMQVSPVQDDGGDIVGATVTLQDASSEASLEEKCQSLYAKTTRDPLTQVANRAEFDRVLEHFVEVHRDTNLPCSLIMCDIDRFKSINDKFGHQAGDEAIIGLAKVLKSMCRSGDFVARYGGEEFAVLCADCNNATAAQRAEQIRKVLAETSHACLANNAFTVSFGVSELQNGDTPETLLRRSDRALLQAKEQGRNQVVQLGDGMHEEAEKRSWFSWGRSSTKAIVETTLSTNVPIDLAIQKLQGFISDHEAKIRQVTDEQVRLDLPDSPTLRDRKERAVPFRVEIKFLQQHQNRTNTAGLAAGRYAQTVAEVKICPRRDRDKRNGSAAERARLLLGSLKSYLMAREEIGDPVE